MALSAFFRLPLHEIRRLTLAELREYTAYMNRAKEALGGR